MLCLFSQDAFELSEDSDAQPEPSSEAMPPSAAGAAAPPNLTLNLPVQGAFWCLPLFLYISAVAAQNLRWSNVSASLATTAFVRVQLVMLPFAFLTPSCTKHLHCQEHPVPEGLTFGVKRKRLPDGDHQSNPASSLGGKGTGGAGAGSAGTGGAGGQLPDALLDDPPNTTRRGPSPCGTTGGGAIGGGTSGASSIRPAFKSSSTKSASHSSMSPSK